LQAIDPDTESGSVQYKLLNVTFIRADHYASSGGDTQIDSSPAVAQTFDLDANSGSLTTSQTYGLFVDGYFLIHVCAWAGVESASSRKSFNTLRVFIPFPLETSYCLYRSNVSFLLLFRCSSYFITGLYSKGLRVVEIRFYQISPGN
jgi:hypothetical protein